MTEDRNIKDNISSDKKVVSLYELEYEFIPFLVELYQYGEIPVEALLDKNHMKEWLLSSGYTDFEFDFNDFYCDWKTIDDNHAIVLYTFPKSYRTPLAKYGAVLMQKFHKDNASYYTLERSDDIVNMTEKINWVLGSMSTKSHGNFGYVPEYQDIEDFKNMIISKFLTKFSITSWIKGLFKRK